MRLLVLACLAVLAGGGTPATFIFGDSLVDAGNNNYIASLSKANTPCNTPDTSRICPDTPDLSGLIYPCALLSPSFPSPSCSN